MDEAVLRTLKLFALLGVAGVFLVAGLWAYLGPGLVLGLAGPVFAGVIVLFVANDVYTAIAS